MFVGEKSRQLGDFTVMNLAKLSAANYRGPGIALGQLCVCVRV